MDLEIATPSNISRCNVTFPASRNLNAISFFSSVIAESASKEIDRCVQEGNPDRSAYLREILKS